MANNVDTLEEEKLELTAAAITHFEHLLAKEEGAELNLRITVDNPGTPQADLGIVFCPVGEEHDSDQAIEFAKFTLFIEEKAVPALRSARIDYKQDDFGGELAVKAPFIKGEAPALDADLFTKIAYLIENEINPSLASHGGFIKLIEVTPANEVVIQFGGGCQGCGMADVTLKSGIEKNILESFPEVTAIVDATDHASGANPYY